jgi:hypothetical protein
MISLTGAAARRLILADLSAGKNGAARRLSIAFGDQVDRIAKLQIYAVSEHGRRLIASLDVLDN